MTNTFVYFTEKNPEDNKKEYPTRGFDRFISLDELRKYYSNDVNDKFKKYFYVELYLKIYNVKGKNNIK